MRFVIHIYLLFCVNESFAQERVGIFGNHTDVGSPKLAGLFICSHS
jgi:hypothetical protein